MENPMYRQSVHCVDNCDQVCENNTSDYRCCIFTSAICIMYNLTHKLRCDVLKVRRPVFTACILL